MCLCGEAHIGLRRLNWRAGSSLIRGVRLVRLLLGIGRRGMSSLYGIECSEEPVPSFMLMDLQGMGLVLYIYTLENGQIKVEKVIVPGTMLIVAVVSERGVITVLRNSIDTN